MALKNQKHEKFAQLVADGASALDAYKKAYHCSMEAAAKNAWRLRENEGVKARVSELQEKAADNTVMSIAEKRRFLAEIKRTPIGLVDEKSALCQSYEVVVMDGGDDKPSGELRKIKMPDKLKAIELDSKLAGELKDKTEIGLVIPGSLEEALITLMFGANGIDKASR